jgi:RNA polymerase sigma-70 factor (ECF subfamily)
MEPTRQSLLARAREGEQGAWEDLCELYRPLIVGWLRRQSVPAADLDDLVQEIFLAVVRGLPDFDHSGRTGAFRRWLRSIAFHHSCAYWKSSARRDASPGDDAAAAVLGQLENPDDPLNRYWDEEHDRHVLGCLLGVLDQEFEPTTARAFRRLALEGASGADVAEELGISVAAAYAARSRVLRRLRELAEGLLEEFP